jgi:hypothetical protein
MPGVTFVAALGESRQNLDLKEHYAGGIVGGDCWRT